MTILNIGSGPVEPGKTPGIDITNADRKPYNYRVEVQDMEKLTYPDNTFDLVVCVNALDHTQNAMVAIDEMIRVSKKWVHIDCALIQKTTSGKNHHWDMLEDGTMTDGEASFKLQDFGFEIEFVDNKMERRYNHVIVRFSK